MRIERLRPAHTPEQLARLYARPHDGSMWRGHRIRLALTEEFGRSVIDGDERASVADLSCGSSLIADRLSTMDLHLGDFAVLPADRLADMKYHGPIEHTLELLPCVDLLVCTETLEHLDSPGRMLLAARVKARRLLLSTPIEAWFDREANEEHYWAWDREGVEQFVSHAGWQVEAYMEFDTRPFGETYQFGTWVLR